MKYDVIDKIKHTLKNRIPQPITNYSPSAVMLLLFPINNELHLLFTKRAEHLMHQPGDISFPGGRKENDEILLETALRETQEELGISPKDITVLGSIDFMLTAAGIVIMPFIGFVPNIKIEQIHFSTDEVAEIFTVPISFLRKRNQKYTIYIFLLLQKKIFPMSVSMVEKLSFCYSQNPRIILSISAIYHMGHYCTNYTSCNAITFS